MPYNTTAIPPRKEPTGQAQLPLSRIKRIVAQDPDVGICSNNAAFVITLAALHQEMFIQHLADEAHTQAKVDTKPRRNIQYKDVANAVARQDNLEFLEDVVPKTVPYKNIKTSSRTTQARLRGDIKAGDETAGAGSTTNGAAHVNGDPALDVLHVPAPRAVRPVVLNADEDPSSQLEMEMRQAAQGDGGVAGRRDEDVYMTG
ncbi:putative transcription factor-like protein [Hapsidospora chrysogenum ATCC 11550]|uniref:Putative transcription factor-like protein n=1 Tax=Hapsidospora chrysogenum (strain ATCC 11550 / CBS 779.69 / DSM 880 / IAM 14645 / JCM 23072 / IMI 49137) TaxID=857340 RepID=A0A086T1Z9_HAPC1|nr:putative transcription factor-like protein [Hapsidospora chrysogenum ATCC 11550]